MDGPRPDRWGRRRNRLLGLEHRGGRCHDALVRTIPTGKITACMDAGRVQAGGYPDLVLHRPQNTPVDDLA